MAVTRRGYIFAAFLSSVLSVLLLIVALSSDSWIVSTTADDVIEGNLDIRYGLFRGEINLRILATSTLSIIQMTCVPNINACAVSCKTTREAREQEVEALAQGHRPNTACGSTTTVDITNPLKEPAVISFAFYISLLMLLFIQLMFSLAAAGLAIGNATLNPTEPIFGLPGCLWSNVLAAVFGIIVLLLFGIYYATSGLKNHMALAQIAVGLFTASPSLGYSYWIQIPSVLCSLLNVGLIELRRHMLERDPPPPTIKVENHSDGTLFLY